ncbi:MAG TPA: long-chain fatty acid--CoA ligase, partial [Chromatiales bacterium]|nr:long-chain fatty acid--CoA ligase [Chromatiales bacterium]
KVVLDRLARCIKDFPGYAQIRSVTLYLDPWTVENGFLTPTLKIKRSRVMEACAEDIEAMYAGH